MTNLNNTLKRVTISELIDLQEIARQTFIQTYAHLNTEENMQHYLEKDFSEQSLAAQINHPGTSFYFSKIGDFITGYVKLNTNTAQTELKDRPGLEIERIYILRDFQGKKIGQFLFDESLKIAKNENKSFLWLGVWEHNSKALQFYQKNGLVPFDTHMFQLGDDLQKDIMMKIDIISADLISSNQD